MQMLAYSLICVNMCANIVLHVNDSNTKNYYHIRYLMYLQNKLMQILWKFVVITLLKLHQNCTFTMCVIFTMHAFYNTNYYATTTLVLRIATIGIVVGFYPKTLLL